MTELKYGQMHGANFVKHIFMHTTRRMGHSPIRLVIFLNLLKMMILFCLILPCLLIFHLLMIYQLGSVVDAAVGTTDVLLAVATSLNGFIAVKSSQI